MSSNKPFAGNINGNQESSTPTLDDINKATTLHSEANECIKNANDKEAIEKLTQALELFPTPARFCKRAICYGATKQYDNAIKDCHSALELDPKYALAHSVLGKAFRSQNRYKDAIDAYKKALQLNPEDELTRNNFAIVEKNLKAKEMSNPTPEDVSKANALKEQGNECMKASKFNEAIEKYTQAIALNLDSVYLCNRAAANFRIKEYDNAIIDCKDAIFLDDKYAKAHGRMGFIASCLGNYFVAVESYENALELDPNNESYKKNFALAKAKIREANHQ